MISDKCPECNSKLIDVVEGSERLEKGEYVSDVKFSLYCMKCGWDNDYDDDEDYLRKQ